MTDTTDIAALTRPIRDRYDWSNAVWRDCDHCGKQHTGTVTAEDGSQICAHCADQLYWSAWQVLAEQALDRLEAERQRADAVCRDIRIQANDLKSAQTVNKVLQEEIAALKPDVLVMPDSLHRDTKALLLVFASAMAAKLHKAEQKYGYSNTWMQADWQDKCLADFNHHISKGDPLDVANYCAFMHYHGWPTALKGEQVPVAITDDMTIAFHAATTDSALGRDDMEEIKAGLRAVQELFTVPQKPVVFRPVPWRNSYASVTLRIRDEQWHAAIEAAGGIVSDK